MANYFPFYLNIEKRPILIFGGGSKAYEKIDRLLACGPTLTVAAEKVTPSIKRLGEQKRISLVRSDGSDAETLISRLRPMLVIVADVDEDKQMSIFRICRKKGIDVNTVDKKELSTFLLPAVIKRGHISVAVSTFGESPAAAKWLRDHIESSLPAALDGMMDHLGTLRQNLAAKAAGLKQSQFAAIYREFLDTALRENRLLSADEITQMMTKYIDAEA